MGSEMIFFFFRELDRFLGQMCRKCAAKVSFIIYNDKIIVKCCLLDNSHLMIPIAVIRQKS